MRMIKIEIDANELQIADKEKSFKIVRNIVDLDRDRLTAIVEKSDEKQELVESLKISKDILSEGLTSYEEFSIEEKDLESKIESLEKEMKTLENSKIVITYYDCNQS